MTCTGDEDARTCRCAECREKRRRYQPARVDEFRRLRGVGARESWLGLREPCEAPGCTRLGTHGKPFCIDHLGRCSAYTRDLLVMIELRRPPLPAVAVGA